MVQYKLLTIVASLLKRRVRGREVKFLAQLLHLQRERGKVSGVGVHVIICLWTKTFFESYFSNQLTFSNIRGRTSR